MKKILISGLGGSLFPYLSEYLKRKYEVYYIDADINLRYIYSHLNFIPVPLVSDKNYTQTIIDIIKKYHIEVYIPLIDEEIEKAHKIIEHLDDLILISPTKEFSELCLNKYRLMKYLDQHNISFIKSEKGNNDISNLNYPIFVKPIYGRGSRGICKINTQEELNAYYVLERYKREDVLLQEYIQGQEYTVGVLTNNLNDILSIGIRKVLNKKGITTHAVTENNEVIRELVFKINKIMKPCGPYNVQLFLDKDNNIKIFEINPRFSTTSVMSFASGIDEFELFIKNYNKKYVDSIVYPKEKLYLRRNWRNNFYE